MWDHLDLSWKQRAMNTFLANVAITQQQIKQKSISDFLRFISTFNLNLMTNSIFSRSICGPYSMSSGWELMFSTIF